MDILSALASVRSPLVETIAGLITMIGDETIMIVVGMIVCWCFSSKNGYKLLLIAVMGMAFNGLLKLICAVPRPWTVQEGIAVASALETATGYSFPSGHTQTTAMVFALLASLYNKKSGWIAAAIVTLLVGFSRLVLGVHYPTDVLGGLILGAVSVAAGLWISKKYPEKSGIIFCVLSLVFAIASIIYSQIVHAGKLAVDESLFSGLKDQWTVVGVSVAALIAVLMKMHENETVQGVWWAQVLKLAIGFALVMGVRLLFKAILPVQPWSSGVRYFFVGLVGLIVWPMTFGFWKKLGQKN